jgi:hypothetical protein
MDDTERRAIAMQEAQEALAAVDADAASDADTQG